MKANVSKRARLAATVLLASLVGVATGSSAADKSDEAAFAFGKRLALPNLAVCGNRTFAMLSQGDRASPPLLGEIKNPRFSVDSEPVSVADKLNGIEWHGWVELDWDAYRVLDEGKWTPWMSPHDRLPRLDVAGSESVFIRRTGGQWVHDNGWDGDRDFVGKRRQPISCDTVLSADTPAQNHADGRAHIQVPPAQPVVREFRPNTKMRLGFKVDVTATSYCWIEVGTAIEDRGPYVDTHHSYAEPMDFITLPPDVCAQFKPDEHWVVPRRVLELTSEVARTDAPAAREQQHSSLARGPTQTFYAVSAVTVYVHGNGGRVLCTLPPGAAVPARVQTIPPQFHGDFGVLGYKADLCPNAAGVPKDMYNETFFRATKGQGR